ncbi:D-amino acid dehydrogenase [Phenylobacterium sp.]|uniref:D-amino acid dehydrogenase n=1 Tax=Phenylobacterium sp. TaxID=1871053 RepID=UPI002730D12E|nr:D-amino acid dehydrogenase [Phenylobacterium sp.]MDP1618060.1 D-amino acid dehydrogenase [Phenylobacterium sp.]MDP1987287.1 D-amino acid dehydrogenase [Phenylobacterium sp.]
MRVTVLGAGVIGVTTAYYLARAGHEVTVLDRRPGPAQETSFANAGEISPGYASPWAAPGVPLKALQWLTMAHAPLILRPQPDLAMVAWILATLSNCTAARYAINKSRMVRLALYSRDRLIELRTETGLTYDHRSLGTLQLFRTQAQMDSVGKDVAVLEADGVAYEVLDAAGCIAAEPGLAHAKDRIVGGLRLPGDETGDCFKFTQALAGLAAGLGVDFRYEVTIQGLRVDGDRVTAVRTDQGEVPSDAYVVALGSHSPALLRPFGIGLPIYPVKGYSITVPIKAFDSAPVSTLLDESFKIAITRLGDRIRVGGMAELSGYSTDLPVVRRHTLEHSLESLFPGAGATEAASFWSGLRPMTPDSVPLIGPCALGNLFLNTGHGTLGWTMACGSAQVLADQISGVRPAIETRDLSLSRSPA